MKFVNHTQNNEWIKTMLAQLISTMAIGVYEYETEN